MSKKSRKRLVPEHKLQTKHKGHDSHLCSIVSKRHMKRAAGLARHARFVCYVCGRAAAETRNLCEPVEI